jgi:cyclophilin family peptidyl-prolyl cis-trans isomerase
VAGLVAVALVVLAAVAFTSASSDDQAATTTTSVPDPTSSTTAATDPPVSDLPFPEPGATITGPTPCPAEDGSSPRTTQFSEPPPVCLATLPDGTIDPDVDYRAIVDTSVGPLTYLLNTGVAPQTVNSFTVLARYHFWDGAPLTFIVPQAWVQGGGDFAGVEPGTAPGYPLPSEAAPQGSIWTPGMLAMAPNQDGTSDAGELIVGLGELASDLPLSTTTFGLWLDGQPALAAIQRAGTESGAPTQVVTITGITVEPRVPS